MAERRKYIVDTTLRDGEQAPGVVFFKPEKLEIAKELDKLGIEELEIGTPAMGKEEIHDMQSIVALKPSFTTIAWCRAIKSDIEAAELTGVDAVNISFPVSQILLSAMERNRAWVFNQLKDLISFAKSKFAYVYVGAQDASRAEYTFLKSFCSQALALGADRIRIADTVGIMNPLSVKQLFEALSDDFPTADFEFHPHNDLGMASANALTALMCGASGVSCTVNGLGERAGNASLEELIMAMYQANIDNNYDIVHISSLSKMIERYSGIVLQVSKPIVGENAFAHESGIHTNCLLKDKMAYQPFDETRIGKTNKRFVHGKHSGKASIENFFKDKGIHLSAIQLMLIMGQIKSMAKKTKSALSDHHLLQAYHSL